MVPTCVCELGLFDYFIRIGNFSILVYFLFYFVENKFLVWLRKDDDWVVIDRQMLDTMFDNRDLTKEEAEAVAEALEAKAVAEAEEETVVGEEAEEEPKTPPSQMGAEAEPEVEARAEAKAEARAEAEVEAEVETEERPETVVYEDDQKLNVSEVLFGQKENV